MLYQSFGGEAAGGDPAAIFREFASRASSLGFRHFWALNDGVRAPVWLTARSDVEIVRVDGPRYLKCLATCRYLVNNEAFPEYFSRRSGQSYAYTCRGDASNIESKCADSPRRLYHNNVKRNLVHATHVVSSNRLLTTALLEAYGLSGLLPGLVVESGTPRVDQTLSTPRELVREHLGLGSDKAILLYSPSWPKQGHLAEALAARIVADVSTMEERLGTAFHILLLVDGVARNARRAFATNQVLAHDSLATNEVLSATDLLVSDCSALLLDFLVTDRPMIRYAPGAAFPQPPMEPCANLPPLPMAHCTDIEQLVELAQSSASWWAASTSARADAKCRFSSHEDGHATARVVDCFFEQRPHPHAYSVRDHKPIVVLYCGGWRPNGITSSALNLLRAIDHTRLHVLVLDSGARTEAAVTNVRKLDPRVKRFSAVGGLNATLSELVAQRLALRFPDLAFSSLPRSVYAREFRRLLGGIECDAAVDFSGYVGYWALLIVCSGAKRVVIYQHNHMLAEYDKLVRGKYKHRANLRVIFRLYRDFDRIVCVSAQTMEVNAECLQAFAPREKYVVAHNLLAIEDTLALASEEQSYRRDTPARATLKTSGTPQEEKLQRAAQFWFIAIGRLSPEKGHDMLIRAFASVWSLVPNARLFILGDGAERESLTELVASFGLSLSVTLLGYVDNPFPLMQACDCLVQPSTHEGQPMVLLEGMLLGLRVVATNIPGNRSVLDGTSARLVENSVDALVEGMLDAISGRIEPVQFDAVTYNMQAMRMFHRAVLGDPLCTRV